MNEGDTCRFFFSQNEIRPPEVRMRLATWSNFDLERINLKFLDG